MVGVSRNASVMQLPFDFGAELASELTLLSRFKTSLVHRSRSPRIALADIVGSIRIVPGPGRPRDCYCVAQNGDLCLLSQSGSFRPGDGPHS
jgi:hypothetical protein